MVLRRAATRSRLREPAYVMFVTGDGLHAYVLTGVVLTSFQGSGDQYSRDVLTFRGPDSRPASGEGPPCRPRGAVRRPGVDRQQRRCDQCGMTSQKSARGPMNLFIPRNGHLLGPMRPLPAMGMAVAGPCCWVLVVVLGVGALEAWEDQPTPTSAADRANPRTAAIPVAGPPRECDSGIITATNWVSTAPPARASTKAIAVGAAPSRSV